MQWDGQWKKALDFVVAGGGDAHTDGNVLVLGTLEGEMSAQPGDWIIKGVQGEFYPVKPDIFDATYERLADSIPSYRQEA